MDRSPVDHRSLTALRWPTLILVLSMAVFGRHAQADWWSVVSEPHERAGILYWEPRFSGLIQVTKDAANGSSNCIYGDDVTGMTPPDCHRFIILMQSDDLFQERAVGHGGVSLISCMLFTMMKLARVPKTSTFNERDLITDIVERLDLKSFRSSLRYWLPRDGGPFRIGDMHDFNDTKRVYERAPDFFNWVTHYDGREQWFREFKLVTMGDWTDDGKADVPVMFLDQKLYMGTYYTYLPLILTTDSADQFIRGIDAITWFLANRERVVAAFE